MRNMNPFTEADIIDPAATKCTATYVIGFNTSGTSQHEVIQVVNRPDGSTGHYVIMRGVSSAKAAAIVLILNAPEV
jgi:hypothetical protein